MYHIPLLNTFDYWGIHFIVLESGTTVKPLRTVFKPLEGGKFVARYIFKRLLLMIPVILGISLLVFTMMDMSPGDPAQIILGIKATPEALADLRAQMGLDQPFWTRYLSFLTNALRGDFGSS